MIKLLVILFIVRSVIFFQVTFSFLFEIQRLSFTYQKGSSENKLSAEKYYFWVNIFYFDDFAPTFHKSLKKTQLNREMFTNKLFYKSLFESFLIEIIVCEILIYVPRRDFHF